MDIFPPWLAEVADIANSLRADRSYTGLVRVSRQYQS
jgi:hypothetical protein